MNDVRDLLDEQMGNPPPTHLDLDAIIAGQRRRNRARQAGAGVSIAALAGAAAFVATSLVGSASGPARQPAAAGPTAPTAPTTTAPASGATGDTRAAEADRLTTVLQGLLHAALPAAQFARSPLGTALDEPTDGPLIFSDVGTYYVAMAKVTDPAGVSNIIVRVGRTKDALVQNSGCIPDPPPKDIVLTCHKTPLGANGFQVNMTTKRGAFLRDLAEVVRPGNEVVDVEIANSVHYYTAERPTLNLTMDQLTALANNPQLATTS